MKQEEYLAAIKKQQSLTRKLFANRKRRSEVIDELTRERYGHLRGKFFKADDERFKRYKGVTYYIAAVHGDNKDTVTDEVVVSLECRYVMHSAVLPGFHIECEGTYDNIAFFTETFRFTPADNLDDILAPLYITEESAAKEVSAMYDEFIKNFLKKG
jgi:hypothetical protein